MDHVSDKKRSKTRVMSIYKSPDAYIKMLEAENQKLTNIISDKERQIFDVDHEAKKVLAGKEEDLQAVSAALAKERAENKSVRNMLEGALEQIEQMRTETVFSAQQNEEITVGINSEYVDRERIGRPGIHYFTPPEAGRFSLGGLRAGDRVMIKATVKHVVEKVTDWDNVKNCAVESQAWVNVISIGRCKPETTAVERAVRLRHPFATQGITAHELYEKKIEANSN